MRIRIASFNVNNMGQATKKKVDKIANIIRKEKFDIVSFQEVLSGGNAIKDNLLMYLPNWDYRFEEPPNTQLNDNRGEGFAFIWNKKTMQLADYITEEGMREFQPRILNRLGNDINKNCGVMARIPYYARFIPVNGGFFELRLINAHLIWGGTSLDAYQKRQEEYNFLAEEIYPGISMNRKYGNNRVAYTIAMGDYNLNLYKPRGGAENQIIVHTYIPNPEREVENQNIITVQDELTTLKSPQSEESARGYSQNYDHFTYDTNMFTEDGVKCSYKRIDAVREYYNDDFDLYRSEISDHVPIVMELRIGE